MTDIELRQIKIYLEYGKKYPLNTLEPEILDNLINRIEEEINHE